MIAGEIGLKEAAECTALKLVKNKTSTSLKITSLGKNWQRGNNSALFTFSFEFLVKNQRWGAGKFSSKEQEQDVATYSFNKCG